MSIRRDIGLLGLLPVLLMAGCFNPSLEGSKFTCRQSLQDCPPGYTCDPGDRICKKSIPGPQLDSRPDTSAVEAGALDRSTVDRVSVERTATDRAADSRSPDHSPLPSCSDGKKNGNESDVDCGGSCPVKCSNGLICSVATDCSGGYCSAGEKRCRPRPAVWVNEAGMVEIFDLGGKLIQQLTLSNASGSYSVRALDVGSFGGQTATAVAIAYQGSQWFLWRANPPSWSPSLTLIPNLTAAATAQPVLSYDRVQKRMLLGVSAAQKCAAPPAGTDEYSALLVSLNDGQTWTVVDTRKVSSTVTTEYRYFPRALALHAGSWIMGTGGLNDQGIEDFVNIIRESANNATWNGSTSSWADVWKESKWSPAISRLVRQTDESLGVYAFKRCSKQGNLVMRRTFSGGAWVWGGSGLVQDSNLDLDWVAAAMNKDGKLVGRSMRGNVYYRTSPAGWTAPGTNMPGCIVYAGTGSLPDDHCMVDVAGDVSTTGDFFAVSGLNKALYKSSDAGQTWSKIADTVAAPLEVKVSRPE